jgi:hypothetical protein
LRILLDESGQARRWYARRPPTRRGYR